MQTQNPNSLEAYKNMQPKIKTDHDKILSVLKKDKPLTYNEIAWQLGWFNPNKVSRRIPELIRQGKVVSKGTRKCTRAKSNCSTYALV